MSHLGRNAADVEARAAQCAATLDTRDLQAELRRFDRRHVPARSAANHHHVVFAGACRERTRPKNLWTMQVETETKSFFFFFNAPGLCCHCAKRHETLRPERDDNIESGFKSNQKGLNPCFVCFL